jgi:hypothetical protein
MPINSYSQILYKCCSEGSLFAVKVLCSQRRFTAEPSIMPPAKPSSNPSSEAPLNPSDALHHPTHNLSTNAKFLFEPKRGLSKWWRSCGGSSYWGRCRGIVAAGRAIGADAEESGTVVGAIMGGRLVAPEGAGVTRNPPPEFSFTSPLPAFPSVPSTIDKTTTNPNTPNTAN